MFDHHGNPISALLAGLLLSVILLLPAHFHDDLLIDTSCVVCFHQMNVDSDMDSSPSLADVIITRIYHQRLQATFTQISTVPAVARGPPKSLPG